MPPSFSPVRPFTIHADPAGPKIACLPLDDDAGSRRPVAAGLFRDFPASFHF